MKNLIYASLAIALATLSLAACGGGSGGGTPAAGTVATANPYTMNQYGQCVQAGTNNIVPQQNCAGQGQYNLVNGQCVQTNTNQAVPYTYCQNQQYGGQQCIPGQYCNQQYGQGQYGQGQYGPVQGGIMTQYGFLPTYVCPQGLGYYNHVCYTPMLQPVESTWPY